ncbi:MAG: uroporphyrinogen decarboxylase family protein, partial [Pseudomonadota bacterium]
MESYKCSKILRMLDGERTGEVFCSPNISVPTWDIMDAINVHFPDAHMVTDQIVKLAESSYTLLGFDSIRSGSDIGVEAHALGAEVNMGGRESFVYVTKPAFDDPEAFDVPSNLLELGRCPINFEAVSILKG